MSDYSIINILEIKNTAKDDNVTVRFGRKYLQSRDLGVSLFQYKPGFRSSRAHSHKVQEEAYIVVKGSGRILLNDEVKELKLWDVVRVAPPVTRSFEAGPEGLEVIAVGGPKPEEGDGVMANADWPVK
jgi:quercetin dioxygenase-like cupin family protein